MTKTYGPVTPACDFLHAEKYRGRNESFRECATRVASALSDDENHFARIRDILLDQRFLPAGRIQGTVGSTRSTTPYNCFVSGQIEDSFIDGHGSIMHRATEAAGTMRLGGGIGYDFSTLRPRGDVIKKLQSFSSGPISFMDIFDAVGLATASSGHRRGAQMGVLRIDHPDIEEFIRAKQNNTKLLGFNISVGVTNEFMRALEQGTDFDLRFAKRTYRTVNARALWELLMRSTYDWSEPGVLFLDTINQNNNLWYCEVITATNPCGEQPLPPFGACLLGSINLPKYLIFEDGHWLIDHQRLYADIPHIIRAMDNVVDLAKYPLHEQEQEAQSKRRMGIGVTGVANAIEALGFPYASKGFRVTLYALQERIKNVVYRASANLAREKGSFPLFDRDRYLEGAFIQTLDQDVLDLIQAHGIRNSHLLSIAPTGTISTAADNVSSGIEPVFALRQKRLINYPTGVQEVELEDYGSRFLATKGKTADECTAEEHLSVLITATAQVDSAVSKTCNVRTDYPWEDFQDLYIKAWKSNCKGCTTHRTGNFRGAILKSVDDEPIIEEQATSCELDPVSGRRSCE
jgi:ribonucleoside-diphosphate reductase alpha chain